MVWSFLKNLIEPPYDPGIPLLDIYAKRNQYLEEIRTSMLTAALSTNKFGKGNNQETIGGWMYKEDVGCVFSGIFFHLGKEGNPTSATIRMNLEDMMPSEVSRPQEDKHRVISAICGILKSWTHRNREVECRLPQPDGWGEMGRRRSNCRGFRLWVSSRIWGTACWWEWTILHCILENRP